MCIRDRRTPGFSGAELANVLNEAALLAVRQGHQLITLDDVDEAIDRVIAVSYTHLDVYKRQAYDLSDIEEEFTRAGADAFITKPLFKSKILHVLSLFCTSEILNSKEDILREHYSDICGSRILLIEDNELNREIAEELLSMKGVLVESAANGEEALKMYNTSPEYYYTAILMDIQMPVMNGYEATKHIRQLKREDVKSIPIDVYKRQDGIAVNKNSIYVKTYGHNSDILNRYSQAKRPILEFSSVP